MENESLDVSNAEVGEGESNDSDNKDVGNAVENSSDVQSENGDTGQDSVGGVKENSEDVIEEKKEESEKKEEAKENKFKIKVDGKSLELSEKEVINLAQKAMGADKAFREASQVRNEIISFFSDMRNNPSTIPDKLEKMGIDFSSLAEQYLTEKYTYENLPEEQRLLIEKEKELEKYRLMEQRKKQEDIESYNKSIESKIVKDLDNVIVSVLSKSKYLPQNSPESVSLLSKYVLDLVTAYYSDKSNTTPLDVINDIDWNALLNLAEKEYISNLSKFLDTSDEDAIKNILGKNGLKKVNNISLGNIKKQDEKKRDGIKQGSKGNSKILLSEYRKMLDSQYG
jgi:hypothetical protein